MRRFVEKQGDRICIFFPYSEKDVTFVRTLTGRKYHPKKRFWSAPITVRNVELLSEADFELCWDTEDWLEKKKFKRANPKVAGIVFPEKIKDSIKQYQAQGVEWLIEKEGNGIIADEMGLGKTLQALGYITTANFQDVLPAVVVCPASIKVNWKREVKKWTNKSCEIISGNSIYKLPAAEVYIINYSILQSWQKEIRQQIPVKTIILDESHYIKNPNSARSKAAKKLCKGVKHRIPLTGTPITSKPADLFETLRVVKPDLFVNRWDFLKRYCDLKNNGFGWQYNGATNTEELHEILFNKTDGVVIRRMKTEVYKELGEKQKIVVPIELDNREEYDNAKVDFTNWIASQPEIDGKVNPTALAKIGKLKQLSVKGKIKNAIKWTELFLENENKLVLFCHHKDVVSRLKDHFKDECVVLSGGTSPDMRQTVVDQFQQDESKKLFIGTLAAIEGITLTAACSVAFLELWWLPSQHDQAEDRVHRIGQNKPVTAYYLLGEDTIDEIIAKALDKKKKIIDKVLHNKQTDQSELLSEIIREFKNQHV